MRHLKAYLPALFALFVTSVGGVHAGTPLLLLFPAGGRAGALAGAFTSVADGAETVFYNPAGLSTTTRVNGGIVYRSLGESFVSDIFLVSADLSMPIQDYGVGMGVIYEKVDESGSYDLYAVASYGMRLGKESGLGLGMKYLRSVVEGEGDGSAIGFDIGVLLGTAPYSVGFSVQNWRQSINFGEREQELPQVIRIGLSYVDPETHAPLSIEYRRIDGPDRWSYIHAGVEVPALPEKLYLRAGYMRKLDSGEDSILLGLGIRLGSTEKSGLNNLSDFELNAYDDLRVGGSQDMRVELRRRPL